MDKTDEFAGQGGSYLLDPKTGKRTLVHRTQHPAPGETDPEAGARAAPAPSGPEAASPAAPAKPKKGT